jgi:hypothetical protein
MSTRHPKSHVPISAEKKEALDRLRRRQDELVRYVESKPKAAANGMTPDHVRKTTDAIILGLERGSIPAEEAETKMAGFGVQVQDACIPPRPPPSARRP